MEIKRVDFPDTQYFNEPVTLKNQIYLHHTVSDNAKQDIDWWKSTDEKVATSFIIDKDGTINQLFDDECWAWHLGLKTVSSINNKGYNQHSVGIEIVNEGGLTKRNDKLYWGNNEVYNGEVFELTDAWRGFRFFAKYTEAQYESLVNLLKMLTEKYNIPRSIVTYGDYNIKLLDFKGILSHCNVRADKTDVSPALDLGKLMTDINS